MIDTISGGEVTEVEARTGQDGVWLRLLSGDGDSPCAGKAASPVALSVFAIFRAWRRKEGRKIYMYALTKPHGSCRGSSGSDMHKQSNEK